MAKTCPGKLIAAACALGLACVLQMAGCGGADRVLPSAQILDPVPPAVLSAAPGEPAVALPVANEAQPLVAADATPVPVADEKPLAKTPEPPARTTAKAAAAPIATTPARKGEAPAAAAKAPDAPLDVTSLKARLRETAGIGVLAKLSLRSQVDELIEAFRLHYEGGQKTSLASLRKPYDALVMKVLDLLQEGDPPLARSIAGSREAIWAILADREKFNLAR